MMQKQNILYSKSAFGLETNLDRQFGSRILDVSPRMSPCSCRYNPEPHVVRHGIVAVTKSVGGSVLLRKTGTLLEYGRIKVVGDGNSGELSDEDEDLCPAECVREFKTDKEFLEIIEKAKKTNALVVVDFYRTSCGSCKYIEQGFAKLCRAAGDEDVPVIFLKHNVIDEYDEQSEVAERLRIKKPIYRISPIVFVMLDGFELMQTVPLFHFYKGGVLLESFATRDKERIDAAILKYTTSVSQAT